MKTLTHIRWIAILGLALLIFTSAAVVFAQHRASSNTPADWPHFGYDGAFTACNALESTLAVTNVATLERKWGVGCDDGYFSVISRSPTIYDGKLYTSGAGSKLTAYHARTGQKLWQFGAGNAGWAPQPVVSADGIAFYMEGSYPTQLYAVNANTGSKLWEAPLAFDLGFNDTAQVTVDEAQGLVYLIEDPFAGGGKLYALSKQTGAVVWHLSKTTPGGTEFQGDYALLAGGKIYAPGDAPLSVYPFHGEHMLKVDTTTHNIETTYDRPVPENYYDIHEYTLCNDNLVVTFDYQYEPIKQLVAYNPISPTIAWQKPFSETTGTIACNPALNRIYVPTDPYLYALDATTGTEIWKYQGYGAIYNPSVANGVIYFLSDTNMYAIDEISHTQLLHYPLGYEAYETTQVAIANGMAYFSGNGGTCDLFALGLPGPKVYLPSVMR
ncbi:hypothetical protein TFLX_02069 [Thermoflexales bacterium]|nr:hypothetical protein TFLX_02069 [Thermoflexales bacterium]